MPFQPTDLPGVMVFEPRVFEDPRGWFFESYNQKTFQHAGIDAVFVQDNQSFSGQRGIVRGLHYQNEPFAQAKLVRVLEGQVYDVAVDIRKGSPTFGKFTGMVLSAENKKQLFVPRGFAHGFSVLSDHAVVLYKCDNFYSREQEGGILYNDPAIGIDWKISEGEVLLSDKDARLPLMKDADNQFVYSE